MTTTLFDDESETMPTETIPPTDRPTYTQRVFRYDTHTGPVQWMVGTYGK